MSEIHHAPWEVSMLEVAEPWQKLVSAADDEIVGRDLIITCPFYIHRGPIKAVELEHKGACVHVIFELGWTAVQVKAASRNQHIWRPSEVVSYSFNCTTSPATKLRYEILSDRITFSTNARQHVCICTHGDQLDKSGVQGLWTPSAAQQATHQGGLTRRPVRRGLSR